MKNKITFIQWVKEHVRPHVYLERDPDETNDEKTSRKDKLKQHSVVGIKLKWRF